MMTDDLDRFAQGDPPVPGAVFAPAPALPVVPAMPAHLVAAAAAAAAGQLGPTSCPLCGVYRSSIYSHSFFASCNVN